MRITLLCVGRLGERPEARLSRDYARRAQGLGRSLALSPVEIVEVEGRKRGAEAEARALLDRRGEARLIACDERGQSWSSRALATELAGWRDDGVRELTFIVGGADGLTAHVLGEATARLAFGPQTWPHALARVMLAEQIYRAVSILAGAPYHHD
ncbi:MAG: 23S rRNA (pseudouridine(1915)-N(3))-methyltransferase RlmH [Caulobacteraceae bacterium]